MSFRPLHILIPFMLLCANVCLAQMGRVFHYDEAAYTTSSASPAKTANGGKDAAGLPIALRYTKQHPIVFVAPKSYFPFAFYNDQGKPDGFAVNLVKEIFSQVHVPYEIRLLSPQELRRQILSGEAQLMIDMQKPDGGNDLTVGHISVAPQQLAVARLYSTQAKNMIELFDSRDTITVFENGYAYHTICSIYPDSLRRPFHLQQTASGQGMTAVASGKVKYLIASRPFLAHHIRRFNLQDIVTLDDINITEGKYYFISSDPRLVEELEAQLVAMRETEIYQQLVDQWLAGNVNYERPVGTANIIAIVVLITIFLIVVFIFVIAQRRRNYRQIEKEFKTISRLAVEMTGSALVLVDVRRQWVKNIHGDFLPKQGISFHEYTSQYIHPDDTMAEFRARQVIDRGKNVSAPTRFRMRKHDAPDGQWRNVCVNSFTRFDSNGKPIFVMLIIADETEQLLAQRELTAMQQRFVHFTDISELGIMHFDADGHYVNCNKSLIDFLSDNGKHDVTSFLSTVNLSKVSAAFGGVEFNSSTDLWFCGPIKVVELELDIMAEIRIRAVASSSGKLRGYTISIFNLAARKQLLSDIYSTRQALNKTERQRRRYLNESQMLMKHNDMRLFHWDYGNDYLDVADDDLHFNRRRKFTDILSAVADAPHEKYIKYLISPGQYFIDEPNLLHHYVWREGNREQQSEWLRSTPHTHYDSKGNIQYCEGIILNVTKQVNMERQLKQQEQRVARLGQEKTEFLSNMTHELRTPLNIVNGFAEVLPFTDDARESDMYLNVMAQNTAMLLHIATNVLNRAVYDANGLQLHNRTVDFAELFAQWAERFRIFASHELPVEYRIERSHEHLMITLDADRVMRILEVFVTNAVKNTHHGNITVGFRYHDGNLIMYCSDTGIGISAADRRKIFTRFYKVDEFVPGVGLGLSVADTVARAMHAAIRCYSRPGEGSIFMFCLRIAQAGSSQHTSPSSFKLI